MYFFSLFCITSYSIPKKLVYNCDTRGNLFALTKNAAFRAPGYSEEERFREA